MSLCRGSFKEVHPSASGIQSRNPLVGLPSDETLLMQMPAVVSNEDHPLRLGVRDPVTFKVDRTYEDCFLWAHTKGGFEKGNITQNDIEDAYGGMFPNFITMYEETLR
ncbi:hypothetical protein EDB86DRAFT_2835558 [Lactarius hatsudake]|nr:hypothetical protein EDB86DRAFT_2835558 [Lactarius hatsudake]